MKNRDIDLREAPDSWTLHRGHVLQRVGWGLLALFLAAGAFGVFGPSEAIFRALAVYVFLQILMRISGRRTLGSLTTFDFIVLMLVAEATQQALLGEDYTIINAYLVIATLIATDILVSIVKNRWPKAEEALEGMPVFIINNGRLCEDKMKEERVDVEDILESARQNYGIGTLEDIKYAILEKNGSISILPRAKA